MLKYTGVKCTHVCNSLGKHQKTRQINRWIKEVCDKANIIGYYITQQQVNNYSIMVVVYGVHCIIFPTSQMFENFI